VIVVTHPHDLSSFGATAHKRADVVAPSLVAVGNAGDAGGDELQLGDVGGACLGGMWRDLIGPSAAKARATRSSQTRTPATRIVVLPRRRSCRPRH
jgi:hypothetical protein